MSRIRSHHFAIFLVFISLVSSCVKEKDDYIRQPTATSVIVTGIISTSDGASLASVPVSVDYTEGSWLAYLTTIHKAKGTTDKNGFYRLFFELEPDKSDNPQIDQRYHLKADLSGLSKSDFILPSDFSETENETLTVGFYSKLEEGQMLKKNIVIPRKKIVRVDLKNYVGTGSVMVSNRIIYGESEIEMKFPVSLGSTGNGSLDLPCAMGVLNKISVLNSDTWQPIVPEEEYIVDADFKGPLLFDNSSTLDACKFSLGIYEIESMSGDKVNSAAPFDLLTFRILPPSGEFKPFDSSRYRYYDSIVWSGKDMPNTVRVYDKASGADWAEESFKSQWANYFFKPGIQSVYLKGFKNGVIVHADSMAIELKGRDFLCYDWQNSTLSSTDAISHTVYSNLNLKFEYSVTPLKEVNGVKTLSIYSRLPSTTPEFVKVEWERTALQLLMSDNLVNKVEYEKAELPDMFRALPEDAEPHQLYENPSTRVLLMHTPESDYHRERYFLHVESKPLDERNK